MGNSYCPAQDFSQLTSVARDICPFPNYTPNPVFSNMLSINSSIHLKNHYEAVQSSLTPQQLNDFTQSLRSTFGREGRVTHGGVGVVALSLAVLFDMLAKQVKGEWVPDSGPIQDLFYKDMRGYYPPQVSTVSEFLRLVPHIANNPTRMREETERYIERLTDEDKFLDNLGDNPMEPINEDITLLNRAMGKWFLSNLKIHLLRLKNTTDDQFLKMNEKRPSVFVFNLNCDPKTADKALEAQVERSDNSTKEAFRRYMTNLKPWVVQVAELEWINTMFHLACEIGTDDDTKILQRGDFDLKTHALGKW